MFKEIRSVLLLLLVFSFTVVSMGNEQANYYFPDTLGSYCTETVETPAGTFDDCLIIEYQTNESTEMTISMAGPERPEPKEQEGTILTTIWLDPNVGIVKFRHEHPEGNKARGELGLAPEGEKTLELIDYEVKGSPSEDE